MQECTHGVQIKNFSWKRIVCKKGGVGLDIDSQFSSLDLEDFMWR